MPRTYTQEEAIELYARAFRDGVVSAIRGESFIESLAIPAQATRSERGDVTRPAVTEIAGWLTARMPGTRLVLDIDTLPAAGTPTA